MPYWYATEFVYPAHMKRPGPRRDLLRRDQRDPHYIGGYLDACGPGWGARVLKESDSIEEMAAEFGGEEWFVEDLNWHGYVVDEDGSIRHDPAAGGRAWGRRAAERWRRRSE